jgi:hypothetical protein
MKEPRRTHCWKRRWSVEPDEEFETRGYEAVTHAHGLVIKWF